MSDPEVKEALRALGDDFGSQTDAQLTATALRMRSINVSGAPALRGYRHIKLLLFGFRASGGVCGQVWWWPLCCASVVIGAGCIG